MKGFRKVLFLTAETALLYTAFSAVSAFAQPVSGDQKSLNAKILQNEKALAKARTEREEIAKKLALENHHLEEMEANNQSLQKNATLNQNQLSKLQQDLLQKKNEQRQLETKYQTTLLEEKKLERAQILWGVTHPRREGLDNFLYEITPPYKMDNNEKILPLFFALLAQKNEAKKENITSHTEQLDKEKKILAAQQQHLKEKQRVWRYKENLIEKELAEAQKATEAHHKSILEHDAEIKKRQLVKNALEQKLADLISEEDLQQRIEQQKERIAQKIQIEKGAPPPPAPIAKTHKMDVGGGISPLPAAPSAKWGEIEDGMANNAIKYPGHANENVVSPVDGLVLFAGNFAGFGEVVILDCGPKTRMVLSGLGKISVKKGEQVQKKQIIGQMPSNTTSTLSLQLRIKNIPVNPAKYLKNG